MKGKRSVFITEPYLLSLHPDREMHVVWIQRQEASGVVHFSETPALGQSVTERPALSGRGRLQHRLAGA